jgi:hypothetical protein
MRLVIEVLSCVLRPIYVNSFAIAVSLSIAEVALIVIPIRPGELSMTVR